MKGLTHGSPRRTYRKKANCAIAAIATPASPPACMGGKVYIVMQGCMHALNSQ
jgi:hypothetical protein